MLDWIQFHLVSYSSPTWGRGYGKISGKHRRQAKTRSKSKRSNFPHEICQIFFKVEENAFIILIDFDHIENVLTREYTIYVQVTCVYSSENPTMPPGVNTNSEVVAVSVVPPLSASLSSVMKVTINGILGAVSFVSKTRNFYQKIF